MHPAVAGLHTQPKFTSSTCERGKKYNHPKSPSLGLKRGVGGEFEVFMKSKLLLVFVLICLNSLLNSITWHIKQDGTGNFTTIQEGIDASADSDTVLVYPDTYLENINYNGKNITVASLELTTGDEQYIYSTIIDGQRLSSCVSIISQETDTCLRGLTITNGQGVDDDPLFGGGISIFADYQEFVQCDIINCLITNNFSFVGGGLSIINGLVYLSGNSIHHNNAHRVGGGIGISGYQVEFDPANRCSIYNNIAATGIEIFIHHINEQTVILDTFTVAEPTRYFAQSYPGSYNYTYNFDILNHTLVPIDHDLYVSPEGNDENSGLIADEPLKTINLAVRNIASNSDDPHTIYLAAGTYSKSLNQQQFAFGCKEYVNIIGEDMNTTIIDGEMGGYPFFYTGPDYDNSTIKNMTFQNGSTANIFISTAHSNLIRFENIIIQDCISTDSGAAICSITSGGNIQLKNVRIDNIEVQNLSSGQFNETTFFKAEDCTFSNNTSIGYSVNSAGLYAMSSGDIIIENCEFINNNATSTLLEGYASALLINDYNYVQGDVRINNCLFYDNSNTFGKSTIYAQVLDDHTLTFTNNTMINNESPYGIEFQGNINCRNNILRNIGDYEIALFDKSGQGIISEIDISNCNILGGESAIFNENGVNIVNWLEGNIDEDPLFFLSGDDPYQLTLGSPCVDTGTPDTTGLFLPPWDLLHNYRVWDGDGDGIAIIDMGCYEFDAPSYVNATENQIPNTQYLLTNYPNPFNPETKIVFNLPESGQVKLEIYNIKGQKVKTLLDCYMSPGRSEMLWNSKDDNGKRVSSGVYFYLLQTPTKHLTKKMLLLK